MNLVVLLRGIIADAENHGFTWRGAIGKNLQTFLQGNGCPKQALHLRKKMVYSDKK